jgi:cysteine-rich repeat protein
MRQARFFQASLLFGALALLGCPRGPTCGNGLIEAGEACDDGNTQGGDGCEANCQAPPPFEGNEITCSDNIDNDADGLIDCNDPNCNTAIVCDNGGGDENNDALCNDCIDNDGNGFTDCQDNGCAGVAVCQDVLGAETTCAACTDGISNDGDNFTDCDDFDCTTSGLPNIDLLCPVENTNALCSDGNDNDGNSFVDCADFECNETAFCCEPLAQGAFIDSDGDGIGEENANDDICSDGIDNDCNGFTDCADFGCNQNPNVTVCAAGAVSIQEIQNGTIAGGTAILDNVFVTARRGNGGQNVNLTLQEPQGNTIAGVTYPEFAGIGVFIGNGQSANFTLPQLGDCITIAGTIAAFNGDTQLNPITSIIINPIADCNALGGAPAPFVIPSANPAVTFGDVATDTDSAANGNQAGLLAETFEGVLIRVQNVVIKAAPNNFGEFAVAEQSNGTGPIINVDDQFFNAFNTLGLAVDQNITSIQGVFSGANNFKIQPREAADIITQ